MKKLLLPILLFLLFIPLFVNAETCDNDKISISSISIESKSDNVEELDEAIANGKNITLNLSMSEVGDNIEYKFMVKNDSNEDYELDKTSLNLNSDYINYSFETDDSSNVVKANSSKNVILRVEYKTEVPEDKFESGLYNDNKTMTVQLSNGNTINVPDTFKNPNTGVQSYILVFLIVLLVSGTLYVVLKKKKYTKFMILIIGGTIIIPISVYALCKCEIKVDSNVEIKIPKYKVYMRIKSLIEEDRIKNGEYVVNNYAISQLGRDFLAGCEDDYQIINNKKYYSCMVYKNIGEYYYLDDVTLGEYTYEDYDGNLITYSYYAYAKNFNPYFQNEDKSVMNNIYLYDTLSVTDWHGETEDPSIYISSDDTFKMPKHDIYIDKAYRYSGHYYPHVVY